MSSSEAENSTKDAKASKEAETKLKLKKMKEVKKLEDDELYKYIEKLHELLKKNEKKLRKYKDKIKKLLEQLSDYGKTKDSTAAPVPESDNKPAEPHYAEKPPDNSDAAQEETTTTVVTSFVDEIRQAAEQAQNLNGFVYEPTSGLYYDQKTGYYYNAEYGLYYDGNTGCYYNYNQEKNAFEFHSQVEAPTNERNGGTNDDNDVVEFDEFGVITDANKLRQIKEAKAKQKRRKEREKKKKKKEKKKSKKHARKSKKRKRVKSTDSDSEDSKSSAKLKRRKRSSQDFEDGELSTSSSSSSSSSSSDSKNSGNDTDADIPKFKGGGRFQDIAKKYPPSLRIIVQETNLDELKVGSLSLITYKGGSLGREGNHDVIIPDLNVSKFHLKFNYDTKNTIYKCVDLGSRNGTILNGSRMSTSKTESEALDVVHGSVLQIAQTKLLCHVHEGNSTCGLCEPGLLIETPRENVTTVAAATVVLSHKEQLKKLQKKYGLENEKFVDGNKSVATNYNDRAATRRVQVGSSTDKEKTQTASVNTAISSENKGFKMLSKLGWSKGEALGKASTSSGLLEPINVSSNEGKKGLGCDEPAAVRQPLTAAEKKKFDTWKKTQARYQKADIFSLDSDDSN